MRPSREQVGIEIRAERTGAFAVQKNSARAGKGAQMTRIRVEPRLELHLLRRGKLSGVDRGGPGGRALVNLGLLALEFILLRGFFPCDLRRSGGGFSPTSVPVHQEPDRLGHIIFDRFPR